MLIHALYSTAVPSLSLCIHILLYGHHALDCEMSTDKIGIDIHLHDSSVHDKYRYFWKNVHELGHHYYWVLRKICHFSGHSRNVPLAA